MNIAVCQYHIQWENKELNIKQAESYIAEAKEKGAELIVFPEMSFTGFSMNLPAVEEVDTYTIDRMKQLSTRYHICIGFGWVKKGNLAAENHYTIVDFNGNSLSDYIKMHPFSYGNEDKYFTPGDQLSFCQIGDQMVSTFICYDLRFPEIFQAASRQASVLLVAANWAAARKDHFLTLIKARAIENQCYVVACNCVGDMQGEYYSGNSSIIAPDGKVIETLEHKEGLLMAELSINVNEYRKGFSVKTDRREELYCRLYNR